MIAKLGFQPGGSWVFHSARQFCQVGEKMKTAERLWTKATDEGERFIEEQGALFST